MSSVAVSSHVQGASLTNLTTSSRKRPREVTPIDITAKIETTKSYNMHSKISTSNSSPSSLTLSTEASSSSSGSSLYGTPVHQKDATASTSKFVETEENGVEHMVSLEFIYRLYCMLF